MTVTRITAVEPSAQLCVTTKFAVATASKRWNVSTAAVAPAGAASAPTSAARATRRGRARPEIQLAMKRPPPRRIDTFGSTYARRVPPVCAESDLVQQLVAHPPDVDHAARRARRCQLPPQPRGVRVDRPLARRGAEAPH